MHDRALFDFYHKSVVCEKLNKKMCKLRVKVETFSCVYRDWMTPYWISDVIWPGSNWSIDLSIVNRDFSTDQMRFPTATYTTQMSNSALYRHVFRWFYYFFFKTGNEKIWFYETHSEIFTLSGVITTIYLTAEGHRRPFDQGARHLWPSDCLDFEGQHGH